MDASSVVKTATNAVACDNATFGDPAVGSWKKCWVSEGATTTTTSGSGTTTTPATTSTSGSTTTTPTTTTSGSGSTSLTPPAGAQWSGLTAAMWSEINAQRSSFGDGNDCLARVNSIPSSGGITLQPGADINAALASNSVVFLSGGTYSPGSRIAVPAGKKLIGKPGEVVTINARGTGGYGVYVQDNAVLANIIVDGAPADGVNFYAVTSDRGSHDALVYQVSSRKSGYYASSSGSSGIRVSQGAYNNCIVSSDASESWNDGGGVNTSGGNSDGINNSFGAYNNTFIDVVSYNNGDDGLDMWQGGQSYWYFSNAHDNGKVSGKTSTGNGNGIKVGTGSAEHKFYKTTANNNKACGYVNNGNTMDPLLVQSTASGNGSSNYCYFTP